VVQLIYETHSRTIDNERGIATGWLPGELSSHGLRFAAELGRRWHDTDLAAVYTSDLRRAVQTAEIAFAGCTVTVVQDARLMECNYGALNGMTVARLESERTRHIDTPTRTVRAIVRCSTRCGPSCVIWHHAIRGETVC
jgi:alpha-ribazole phosphatase/probable phosphoglycerate mutase